MSNTYADHTLESSPTIGQFAVGYNTAISGGERRTAWLSIRTLFKTFYDTVYAPTTHAHAATDITSGVMDPNRLAAGTALQVLRRNTGNTALEFATVAVGAGDMIAANNLSDVANAGTARTNLGAAALASPTFTGTPLSTTAAVDTNTTQIATCAFVLAQAASATPIIDGTAAVGTSTRYARADHVHPTDTTRAPLASPTFTGTPSAPTATVGTNTTQIATTAFVLANGGSTSGTNHQDTFAGTGSQVAFTLSFTPAGAIAQVSVNGDIATPTTDYSISGTTLTFVTAPANLDEILVFASSAAAASSTWGGIGGTLSAQTDLNSALALKAALASPTFTGTPAAPTAAVDTNTTQLATTAFVLAQAASATPIIDGTATVGTSTRYARGDHVHPTDTTRAPMASPTFTGTPAAPTAAPGTNTTQLATTAFVLANVGAGGTGDMLSVLTAAEIAITNAGTTLTIDRMHALKATTGNQTNPLPAVSGNTGKFIGIRITADSTKLVTLDGNSSETIDGALTRILWAGETAILFCDGVTWTKVGGKTIPMSASLSLSSAALDDAHAQAITSTTMTLVLHDTAADPSGLMADTSAHTITARRPGSYLIVGLTNYEGTQIGPATRVLFRLFLNASQLEGAEVSNAGSGTYPGFAYPTILTLAAGDVLDHRTYQNSGSTAQLSGPFLNKLTVRETPTW